MMVSIIVYILVRDLFLKTMINFFRKSSGRLLEIFFLYFEIWKESDLDCID